MTSSRHGLVWFRNDLRLSDNPSLSKALQDCERLSAVFFLNPKQWQSHALSPRRVGFTLQALQHLSDDLAQYDIELIIDEADSFRDVPSRLLALCSARKIHALYFSHEYALDETERDKTVLQLFEHEQIAVYPAHASVVIPPGRILTQQGQAFKVFTPFKRAWLQDFSFFDYPPLDVPASGNKSAPKPTQALLKKYQRQFPPLDNFIASESEAHKRLKNFCGSALLTYHRSRDLPAETGTSTLSPYLCMGLLSPRQCLHGARLANQGELTSGNEGVQTWINELVWREFYIHVVAAFPHVCKHLPFRPETDRVAWRHDTEDFKRWCDGSTGFPLVDAAMIQLNTSGWMHNRLRMLTATFLSKHLLIDWRWGERYFMEQLVDGHFAANNGGWQWSASTGTDAAPYFRILSPIRQAERFDPEARFIKAMLPQLTHLPAKVIHKPGHPDLLATGYPAPMVDLAAAKQRCLDAFKFAMAS